MQCLCVLRLLRGGTCICSLGLSERPVQCLDELVAAQGVTSVIEATVGTLREALRGMLRLEPLCDGCDGDAPQLRQPTPTPEASDEIPGQLPSVLGQAKARVGRVVAAVQVREPLGVSGGRGAAVGLSAREPLVLQRLLCCPPSLHVRIQQPPDEVDSLARNVLPHLARVVRRLATADHVRVVPKGEVPGEHHVDHHSCTPEVPCGQRLPRLPGGSGRFHGVLHQ
mmetsp:Transcript_102069/g.218546  ORF Transcript_102069/g.218546 Transcript_102069/m.218546 type:complete len:225 (-) Transcript_102069:129-803(-)